MSFACVEYFSPPPFPRLFFLRTVTSSRQILMRTRKKITSLIRLTVCNQFCRGSCHSWCSKNRRLLPILRCNTSTWDSQCASIGPLLATDIVPLFVHRRQRTAEGPLIRLGHLLAATQHNIVFVLSIVKQTCDELNLQIRRIRFNLY